MADQAMQLYAPGEALPSDPSIVAWPATLPIELALKVAPIGTICKSYGIDREQWEVIKANPAFVAELGRAIEAIRIDGMAFKMRAQLQSVELLKISWAMIQDKNTPANVRADLIKHTIAAAGLNESKNGAAVAGAGGKVGAAFQINIMLGE